MKGKIRIVILFVLIISLIFGQTFYSFAEAITIMGNMEYQQGEDDHVKLSQSIEGSEEVVEYEFEASSFNTSSTFMEISANLTLQEDMIVAEGLMLKGGTIDLNGFKLTIEGSMLQTGGSLNINGGQLFIEEDYIIENASGGQVSANLVMTNESDYVKIDRNFVIHSWDDHSSRLTAGTMEVKGNFTQKDNWGSTSTIRNFNASGTHKVILSGDRLQTVTFRRPGNSKFNELEIRNISEEGIIIVNTLATTKLTTNGNKIKASEIGAVELVLTEDITIVGDVELKGNLDLNGFKLTVEGSMLQTGGALNINGGHLFIEGDYRIENASGGQVSANLVMTNESDYVKIDRNFVMHSWDDHSSRLTAGTMEVKGNFTQKDNWGSTSTIRNFNASGTHKVILSGDRLQTVTFRRPGNSKFNELEIRNISEEGIIIVNTLATTKLTTNGNKIKASEIGAVELVLTEDITIVGDVELKGNLDLNGFKLTVEGSMLQTGGSLNINGGQLFIEGDYIIENASGGQVSANLVMANESDYVKIDRNFVIHSWDDHSSRLTAGTMEVKGNFTQKDNWGSISTIRNFNASGTHKVILSGDRLQTVTFRRPGNSKFNELEIRNISEEGIIIVNTLATTKLTTNGNKIKASEIGAVELVLTEDITIVGDVELKGNLDLNGFKLTVEGSMLQTGGTLNINGGQLFIEGDYIIETASGGQVSANLVMTNESDYIKIDGNFVIHSWNDHSSRLTAGTMEVKGNFTQKDNWGSTSTIRNFNASGTHKVILSGEELQNVSFQRPGSSKFNILGITKPLETGYNITNTTTVWATLTEVEEDKEAPTVPTQLEVTSKTYSTISFSWSGSTDNTRVSGYYIIRDGEYIRSTSSTAFTDKGLMPDTTYTYTVKAYDIYGNESNESSPISVKTEWDSQPPTVPTGLNVESRTNVSISIKWNTSTDNVLVVGYDIYRNGNYIASTSNTAYTDTGLNPYTNYSYTIVAKDAAGNFSTHSRPLEVRTLLDVDSPTIPTNIREISSTVSTITLSWDPSTDNVGVKGYEVYRNGTKVGNTINTYFTDTGLTPDTEYSYTVTAYDAAGNYSLESESILISTAIDTEAPSIPLNLRVSSKSARSITLSWAASTDNVAVAGYKIYRNGEEIAISNITSYADTELEVNQTYSYYIKAYDEAGHLSEKSNTITDMTVKPYITRISPVAHSTIGGAGNTTLWVYFANNNNFSGSRAVVEYSKDGENWTQILNGGGHSSNSTEYGYRFFWDLTDIESGLYNVRYTVYDSSEESHSITTTYNINRTPPSKITGLSAIPQEARITLSWEPSKESDVTKYRIYRSLDLNHTFKRIGEINGRTNVSYVDTTVEPEITYYYKVSAVDRFNQEGDLCEFIEAIPFNDTTPPEIIGMEPLNGKRMGSKASIIVRARDNVSVSHITLQYQEVGSEWTDIETISTRNSATFNWDTSHLEGEIVVRAIAVDTSGNISQPEQRTYTIDTTGPSKVENFTATFYMTSILLRWSDVAEEDFSHFVVERKDTIDGSYSNIGIINDKLGMQVNNLEPNSTYWFRVTAYDLYGNKGTPSDQLEVKTLADTIRPVITTIKPEPGYYANIIPLSASASDNVAVESITFQWSTDLENWNHISKVNIDRPSNNVTARTDFIVSQINEGLYYVRAIAEDKAGNMSESVLKYPYAEYLVDRTAPSAPQGLEIVSTEGSITLKWRQGTEVDLKHYRIYRSTTENGQFLNLANNLTSLGYLDRNVIPNQKYYYKITAVDAAGNESLRTEAIEGELTPDTKKPEIISVYPTNGIKLGANPSISILASDNYRLSKIYAEYKNANGQWIELGSKNCSSYSEVALLKWDTSELSNGVYDIRIFSVDTSLNISEAYIISYELNVEPPSKPQLSVVSSGWSIELNWQLDESEDLAGYRIYRSNTSGTGYKNIASTQDTTYLNDFVTPNIVYYYKVEAVDVYGNTSMSNEVQAMALDIDTIPPKANAGIDQTAIAGYEIAFDGTDSTDNYMIESYEWNLGDGTVSYLAEPVHTYLEAGNYEVTLTVKDPAGNTATDTIKVLVYPPHQVGTVELTVLDESTGLPIPNADVYVDFADDTPKFYIADANGKVKIIAKPGNYNVSAYKKDFLPKEINVPVLQYMTTQESIRLPRGELVVGELTVNRMTLEEIVAVGIDVNAPENQFVYKFEVELIFEEAPLPVEYIYINGHGNFVGGSRRIVIGGGGGPSGGPNSPKGSKGSTVVQPKAIPVENHPEIPPTLAFLTIPQEVSWLKEFFEVGLLLYNQADPQFVITNSEATLKLPEGLSLAPTREKQSYTINIGELYGQEVKEVKWIIRGDDKGYYDIEADFKGTLLPFEAPVKANFKTEEPFRVWGGDALHIYVLAEDSYYVGNSHYTHFILVNESDIPIYNIKTSFGAFQEPAPKTEAIIIYPDGSKSTRVAYGDGTETVEHSDGTIEFINADGSKNITYQDGRTESVRKDGMKTIKKEDGTIQVMYPTEIEREAEGNIYYYEDDSVQYIRKNNPNGGGVSIKVEGTQENQVNVPVMRPGDSLGIECLLPGEMIIGTYVGSPIVVGDHDPDESYFRLVESFVTTTEGSNTKIPVTVSTIPSHMYKYKIVYVDNRSLFADPVDTNSGGHIIEYEALEVNGVTPLTFNIDYNSRLVYETQQIKAANNGRGVDSLKEIGNNTLGNGWSHNYETWLTENKDGSITVYWSPYNYTLFYSGNENSRTIHGITDNYGNITLTGSTLKEELEFRPKIETMKDMVLKRNEDGTYLLLFENDNKYFFDAHGQLNKMEDRNGNFITLAKTSDNKMIITEPATNQTLTINYNEQGLIESVEDKTGRKTSFKYDVNKNLISITDPNKDIFSYTYDDNGFVLTGIDGEGITYFKNTYDKKGRVLTQDDGVEGNELTTFDYDEESEFWRTITTIKDRNGNTSKRVHNRLGQLVRVDDELGNSTIYTYDGKGNRTSMIDPVGSTIIYTYDERGNLLTISDAEKTKTTYSYDKRGNLLTATSDNGDKIINTYSDRNLPETTLDQSGNKTTYSYNEDGQLTKKTTEGVGSIFYTYENGLMKTAIDYLGNSYTYEYDSIGRQTALIDREGNRTTYTYDNVGNLITETDSLGNTTTFKYDSKRNLISEKDAKGNITTFKYNGNGKVIEVTDPKGNKTTYEYDGEDRQTKITDPLGFVAETVYDKVGRPVTVKDALGKTTTYNYDKNGLLLSETTDGGGTTTYDYYKNGSLKSVTNPDGNTTSYYYDEMWQVNRITDAKGNSSYFTYDKAGNLTSQKDALGNTVKYTYDNRGNVLTATDAKGNTTKFTYNANGNLTSVVDALNNKTEYQYDKEERVVKIINALGGTKEFIYDALGRIIEAKDELGNTVKTQYDENWNLIAVKDAYDNVISRLEYDNMNNAIKITDALGNQIENSYDSLGRIVEVLDELNRKTKYDYDGMHRLTKVTDPLKGESKANFDTNGFLTSYTDPNGNTTSYTYDNIGRIISETTAIGSVKTYGYNALSLLESSTNGRGHETTYIYDDIGRLISFTDPVGTVSYTYDENGNVISVIDEKGTISREYDELNRITSYTDYNGNVVRYSYDALGNLISLTYPGGRIVRYEYDAIGNLKTVTDWENRETQYEYDKNGRLVKTIRPNGTVMTITYNAAGQIIQQKDVDASGNIINQYDYEYDAVGNVTVEESIFEIDTFKLTNAVMTYDTGNRLVTYNGQNVLYDEDGNMTYGPLNGEMVTFTYDSRNRLIKAGNTTYEYDAENNRIALVENGIRTEYINNPNAYLSQLLIKKEADGSEIFYTYGVGLIGQEDAEGNYKTYHYDMRGSTTAITDEDGNVVDRYNYGPYGELINHTGQTKTPFLYNGRDGVMTDANGLYYMRARYYNPDIKRFINQDILSGYIDDGRTLNR